MNNTSGSSPGDLTPTIVADKQGWSLILAILEQGGFFVLLSIPWWAPEHWRELREWLATQAATKGYCVSKCSNTAVNGDYAKIGENIYEKPPVSPHYLSFQDSGIALLPSPDYSDEKREWIIKEKKSGDILFRGKEDIHPDDPVPEERDPTLVNKWEAESRPEEAAADVESQAPLLSKQDTEKPKPVVAPIVRHNWLAKLLNCVPKLEHYAPSNDQQVKDNAAVRIYLSFLAMYRNLFFVLTGVSFFTTIPTWGYRPYAIFLPQQHIDRGGPSQQLTFVVSVTNDVNMTGLYTLCSTTILTCGIAFLFALKFQRDCHRSQKEVLWDRRALWLKDLPIRDQATLQPHEVTLKVLSKTVEKDLMEAIDQHLNSDVQSTLQKGSVSCPFGDCPINCGCCGCQLACTLVCTCCPGRPEKRQKYRSPSVGSPQVDLHNGPNTVGDRAASNSNLSQIKSLSDDFPAEFNREQAHQRSTTNDDHAIHYQADDRASATAGQSQIAARPIHHIEDITVQPVMAQYVDYIADYKRIKDAEERVKAYKRKIDSSKPSTDKWTCKSPRSWFEHIRHWWYTKRWNKAFSRNKTERAKFLNIESEPDLVKLEMSGHAFVVFKDESNLSQMLQPARQWYEIRDYTNFKFGRPPFSSVTLQCRHAPHPTDLTWEYLHVPFCPNFLKHMLRLVVLIGVTVIVVALISVFSYISEFLQIIQSEVDLERGITWLQQFRVFAQRNIGVVEQAPTIILLSFNSLIVPLWIDAISQWRKYVLRSWGEMLQLNLNFTVLILSKIVFPFIAICIIGIFRRQSESGNNGLFWGNLEKIFTPPIDVMGSSGIFYLKYCLNCTFLSNAITLTQLARHIFRQMGLWLHAVTESEKRSYNECFVWPWGYWYAWSLTIAANGLLFGIIMPSMLPVTALNFTLKHFVDRQLFNEGAFNPGPSAMGIYAPRVVHLMVLIVAFKALVMGFGMIFVSAVCGAEGACKDTASGEGWMTKTDAIYSYIWGAILCGFAVILMIVSQISKLQQALEEGFNNNVETLITTIGDLVLRWAEAATATGFDPALQHLQNPLMSGGEEETGPPVSPLPRAPRRSSDGTAATRPLSWDARDHALQTLMEKENDDELRNHLCKILGKAWDKEQCTTINLTLDDSPEERQEKIRKNTMKLPKEPISKIGAPFKPTLSRSRTATGTDFESDFQAVMRRGSTSSADVGLISESSHLEEMSIATSKRRCTVGPTNFEFGDPLEFTGSSSGQEDTGDPPAFNDVLPMQRSESSPMYQSKNDADENQVALMRQNSGPAEVNSAAQPDDEPHPRSETYDAAENDRQRDDSEDPIAIHPSSYSAPVSGGGKATPEVLPQRPFSPDSSGSGQHEPILSTPQAAHSSLFRPTVGSIPDENLEDIESVGALTDVSDSSKARRGPLETHLSASPRLAPERQVTASPAPERQATASPTLERQFTASPAPERQATASPAISFDREDVENREATLKELNPLEGRPEEQALSLEAAPKLDTSISELTSHDVSQEEAAQAQDPGYNSGTWPHAIISEVPERESEPVRQAEPELAEPATLEESQAVETKASEDSAESQAKLAGSAARKQLHVEVAEDSKVSKANASGPYPWPSGAQVTRPPAKENARSEHTPRSPKKQMNAQEAPKRSS